MIDKRTDFISLPLVSVIIITYNQENTIGQTIDSILSQQCNFQYEIIIGEDCSIDNTRQICIDYQQRFPEKIKLLLHEKNGGVVKNYVDCVKECSGKYLTACAGDDFWHNTYKLSLQVEYMETHPDCGVLHTDYDELNTFTLKTINSCKSRMNKEIVEGYCQQEIFNGKLSITAPTICFRKDLIDKYVDFDKFLELDFPVEDWPILIILSKYSQVNYLPISTVTYRKGHESLSNLNGYDKIIAKYKREKVMYKYLCNLFPKDLPFDENVYDSYVSLILLNLAYKKFDFAIAKNYSKEILRLGHSSLKVKCATNILMFYVFALLKRTKVN